ncbi:MAG: D-alanine-D-alanine ligase [Clostridia bacterium]|jgi:D-alanine-D-alanine ligase|nr:D-alanine-D-alanine ligase [Clostridia bacterium]MDN5324252.1 D-alanine-D-alanine ligase [Clostridia bacterium]
MKKINVGLLFGGRSGEHEVSLNSAFAIASSLDKEKYNVVPIAIAKNGQWFAPIKIEDIKSFSPDNYRGQEVTILPQPNTKLIKLEKYEPLINLDVIFPIIHGTNGEDGTLQGLLEMVDIPYVGAGVAGSAVGMDKVFMKKIFAYNKLPQVNFSYVLRSEIENDISNIINKLINELKFPLFVKPANLGSSVGVSKAKNEAELKKALLEASKYDRKIIIEEGKEVREIEVSVLGNEQPQASIPGEIIPCNEFYDYKAKYIDDKSILEIPAKLDKKTVNELQKLAVDTYLALDCAGLARVDFFICKSTGKIYINEINTLPGFTAISMYPKLWEYTGVSMPQLLDRLISLAFDRYRDKNKNITNYTL